MIESLFIFKLLYFLITLSFLQSKKYNKVAYLIRFIPHEIVILFGHYLSTSCSDLFFNQRHNKRNKEIDISEAVYLATTMISIKSFQHDDDRLINNSFIILGIFLTIFLTFA